MYILNNKNIFVQNSKFRKKQINFDDLHSSFECVFNALKNGMLLMNLFLKSKLFTFMFICLYLTALNNLKKALAPI